MNIHRFKPTFILSFLKYFFINKLILPFITIALLLVKIGMIMISIEKFYLVRVSSFYCKYLLEVSNLLFSRSILIIVKVISKEDYFIPIFFKDYFFPITMTMNVSYNYYFHISSIVSNSSSIQLSSFTSYINLFSFS